MVGGTFAADEHLTRAGFMGSGDVQRFVEALERHGLELVHDDAFVDIAILAEPFGPTARCDWLEWDRGRCWLKGTEPGEVVETAWERDERLAPGPVGRSLQALAIGDCLGAGVEGWSAESIADAYPTGVRTFRYDPMVWTDDTQQALTLIEATARFGYPDPMWVGDRWVEMAERRIHRGTGRGFRASVEASAPRWAESSVVNRHALMRHAKHEGRPLRLRTAGAGMPWSDPPASLTFRR